MTRLLLMAVFVGLTFTAAAACKKSGDEPKPAADQAAPAEPAPAPDKPET